MIQSLTKTWSFSLLPYVVQKQLYGRATITIIRGNFMVKKKLPRTVRRSQHQTGKTTKAVDKTKKALYPGKRQAKSGRYYTEKRANRSDKSKRKRL